MQSDKVSVTVLVQALALALRSTFFLTFLMGVLREVPEEKDSDTPGCSPCFQCLFLAVAEDEGEAVNAHRMRLQFLGLVVSRLLFCSARDREKGRREEDNEREIDAIDVAMPSYFALSRFAGDCQDNELT